MNKAFWGNSDLWPADVAEKVFLARAFHKIGKAMFHDVWTGEELISSAITPMVWPPIALTEIRAQRILETHAPELLRNHLKNVEQRTNTATSNPYAIHTTKTTYGIGASKRNLLSPELWEAARCIEKELIAKREPLVERRIAVEGKMVERFADATLEAFLRPVAGGNFRSGRIEWWYSERTRQRFWSCQMDPESPFRTDTPVSGYHYIFVGNDGLQRCLDQLLTERSKLGHKLING